MASANDTPMTRFLFAILKQKNLKDIDWTQVACDPILSQPISNGHAARMRYSRFRSHMLGLEPQRKNRPGPLKTKVLKGRKQVPIKTDEPIKPEPGALEQSSDLQAIPKVESPSIKQEICHGSDEMHTDDAASSKVPSDATNTNMQFLSRLLTPASDTDAMVTTQSYASSPASDLLPPEAPYDFTSGSHLEQDHQGMWPQAVQYHPFGSMYNPGPFPGFYEPHHHHHHQILQMQHDGNLTHHFHHAHSHSSPLIQLQQGHELQPFHQSQEQQLAGTKLAAPNMSTETTQTSVKHEDCNTSQA